MTRKQTTYQLQHKTIHNTTVDSNDSENLVIKEMVLVQLVPNIAQTIKFLILINIIIHMKQSTSDPIWSLPIRNLIEHLITADTIKRRPLESEPTHQ